MATTLFEEKLNEYLGLIEKVDHGYYISNGIYHQNLENVEIGIFVRAIRTVREMFDVAFQNQSELMQNKQLIVTKASFWNDLKRQKLRFENIEVNQLDSKAIENNVNEIISEVNKGNQQVISQLHKASAYNLLNLPVIFFNVLGDKKKEQTFRNLYDAINEGCNLTQVTSSSNLLDIASLSKEEINSEEILHWFNAKEDSILLKNKETTLALENSKKEIQSEKELAVIKANKEIEFAKEEAKKAQEEAQRLMVEMQKKYGL